MSETKRTKGSSTRKAAGDSAVLEQEQVVVPVRDEFDDLDDILGEIVTPAKAVPSDDFDDILGEIAGPAPAAPDESLDDILGELAGPAKAAPSDDFDDILGEIAGPAPAAPAEDLDDILGELAGPAKAAPADDFDDILGEIAGPAPAAPAEDIDDILGELAGPAKAAPADDFDDILGEIAGPAPAAPAEDLDDILGELAGPAKAAPADDFDDILGEIAGPATSPVADETKAKAARKRAAAAKIADETDDLSAMLDEMTPQAAVPATAQAEAARAEIAKDMEAEANAAETARSAQSPRPGMRQISRKAYFGLMGAIGTLGLTTIGLAAFILMSSHAAPVAHGPASHGAQATVAAIPIVPIDYSKIDLTRYRDKVRALGEGGRDMLRNPAVKDAILQLDNGEQIYDELVTLSRLSKAADLVSIRDNGLTINSCNLAVCADKSFKLVYDLQRESAKVCMTERYLNGAYLSYSYSPEGYREEPGCNDIPNPAPAAPTVSDHAAAGSIEGAGTVSEGADHGVDGADEGPHGAEH